MKKLLGILALVFISFSGFSQTGNGDTRDFFKANDQFILRETKIDSVNRDTALANNPDQTIPSVGAVKAYMQNHSTTGGSADSTVYQTTFRSDTARSHYLDSISRLRSQVAINKDNIATNTASIATKLPIADTANKWIQTITKNAVGDSFIIYKNGVPIALKDSVGSGGAVNYDFIIGDGGANTPVAGTTTYTNTALIGKSLSGFSQAGINIPLTTISGSAYATFNSSTGVITLHNSVFSNSTFYSAMVSGANIIIPSATLYVNYTPLFTGSISATTGGSAVTNVKQQLLDIDWTDATGIPYVRFVANFGAGILSNDIVELRINDITNTLTFASSIVTVPYLFGTGSTNDGNASVKTATPWIQMPASRVYVTATAYNQTSSRGAILNLKMEVKYQ